MEKKEQKLNNNLGYCFETINMNKYKLFVFDAKIGHNAKLYFKYEPHKWNTELEKRCGFVKQKNISLVETKNNTVKGNKFHEYRK